jgi:methionyl-tRNA synthetase
MLTDEQRSRLDPEQLAIAERWEQDRDHRLALCDKMGEAEKSGDNVAFRKYLDEYLATDKGRTHCEHERSIWSNCAACDEISRLLNPEFFCSKCEEALDEEEQPLVKGMCDYCSQEEDD